MFSENLKHRHRFVFTTTVLVGILFISFCRREKPELQISAEEQSPSTLKSTPEGQNRKRQINYPKGTWWQNKRQMRQVVLSAAHILVSHRSSKKSFGNVGIWIPELPNKPPEEALQLANRVAERVQQHPDMFDEFARKYSDDSATAPFGGNLGVFRAFGVSPSLIDALGHLSVGEVSRVIQSKFGYHILKRLPVPEEQKIAAAQILIEYRGLKIEWTRGDRKPEFSRAEAREVAEKVARQARHAPDTFSDLAEKYSHDINAENGGDLGVWSTYEMGSDSIMLHILSGMKPGEVSRVVDTPIGFRIFKRTDDLERQLFAASLITVAHDRVPTVFRTRTLKRTPSEAARLADEITQDLRKHPERFQELNKEHCDIGFCKQERISWLQGRMLYKVESVVRKLKIGQIALTPVDTPLGFFIIQRQDPRTVESSPHDPMHRKVVKDLPRPAAWTLADYAKRFPHHIVERYYSDFRDKAIEHLKLDGLTQKRFSAIHDNTTDRLKLADKEKYTEIIQAADKQVAKLLGPDSFSKYRQFKDTWFKQIVERAPLVL